VQLKQTPGSVNPLKESLSLLWTWVLLLLITVFLLLLL
jgi:hypothetical protein